ncbi:hypothetical protein ABQZ99_017680 [Xanthomonas hortorum pv. vitians]|uniref:Uncharacterized protein n=2 Tax=Xanthomonas hortorum TaxID=56454 RepID=A0A6V7CGR2_9XANT|nr:hypothetical protein [Xanthomonas hortorum]MCC4625588.1 hypothetical protein [Xanthomonas campestris pv. nigromaculans]NMI20822.1 hypothetical protein [Xanthomonas hortorum pv. pelargonii]APP86578.1 hypothetical protein BI317_23090 [Xanthomonas hortorum pv. gardneri]ASW46728.1 hypothetical protein XJ27_12705 [Xanthomonas hortorum]MCC8493366.1 hypothetical protein [Xanthomonas hortorum pv. gardneri]
MPNPRKIVLHSLHGERPGLAALVVDWIAEGVNYVGVVGVDADRIENLIDDLCVGDGSAPYSMLTAAHGPDESLEDAVFLAELLSDEFAGPVRVIEF